MVPAQRQPLRDLHPIFSWSTQTYFGLKAQKIKHVFRRRIGDKGAEKDIQIEREKRQKWHMKQSDDPKKQCLIESDLVLASAEVPEIDLAALYDGTAVANQNAQIQVIS